MKHERIERDPYAPIRVYRHDLGHRVEIAHLMSSDRWQVISPFDPSTFGALEEAEAFAEGLRPHPAVKTLLPPLKTGETPEQAMRRARRAVRARAKKKATDGARKS